MRERIITDDTMWGCIGIVLTVLILGMPIAAIIFTIWEGKY